MKHDDDHSERKWKIEAAMLEGKSVPRYPNMNNEIKPEATENLREKLCEALGWTLGDQGWQHSSDAWPSALPELDANLIQRARERLLTSRELRYLFMDELTKLTLKEMPHSTWFAYDLIHATPEQQARAILAAIKP